MLHPFLRYKNSQNLSTKATEYKLPMHLIIVAQATSIFFTIP